MKATFRKITFLAFHRKREYLTSRLQELGVLHLETDNSYRNEAMDALEQQQSRYLKVLSLLDQEQGTESQTTQSETKLQKVVEDIHNLNSQYEQNLQEIEVLRRDVFRRTPWGNFDFNKLSTLQDHGIEVKFCIATYKDYNAYEFGTLVHEEIFHGSDKVYFVIIYQGDEPSVPFETVQVPTMSLTRINEQLDKLQQENKSIKDKLRSYRPFYHQVEKELQEISTRLSFAQATGSYKEMAQGEVLSLTGWFPVKLEQKVIELADAEKLTYVIEDPKPTDNIPILLKNKKYPEYFERITQIFELPNYYELDLTPFIAVFYPILFAYCLGDAGYGLVLLIGAVVGGFTFLKNTPSVTILGLILGGFTTLMGVVKSGSVFGIPLVESSSIPFFQFLSQFVIIPDDREFMFNAFNVALMIGVLQVILGIVISILNKLRTGQGKESLAQVGKLLIVSSLIWLFLADMQEMEALSSFPLVRRFLLGIGILMVLFFHDMSVSILVRVSTGVLPLFFIFTGILGDVLSYVRLFALGVASSVLGLVVNQIGLPILDKGWWGVPLGVLFLIAGHALNFGIATLGAFVHPLRLTFVEFYNNAQFQGGGIAYKPFKKIVNQK